MSDLLRRMHDHLLSQMKKQIERTPTFSEPIVVLLVDDRRVGIPRILEIENHVAELRAYVRKTGADAVIVVFNGMYDEPELGKTQAVLTAELQRGTAGRATVSPFLALPSGAVIWGEPITDQTRLGDYLIPYRGLFV